MNPSAPQTGAPVTDEQIKAFAAAWYRALDVHETLENCYTYLADDVFMKFPEAEFGYDGFKDWYNAVTHMFFDEVHVVQSVKGSLVAGAAEGDLDVVVGWQASWFVPPEAKSRRTAMNAYQRWTVRRSDKNQYGLEIVKYDVDRFEYAPGFAQL